MRFRAAGPEDLTTLSRLYTESVRQSGPEAYDPGQVRAWAAFADEREAFDRWILDAWTVLAEDETGILGFAGVGEDGHLRSLYVRGDRQRSGVGTALLRAVLDHADGRSVPVVRTEASEMSRGLFRRFGFRLDGVESVERDGTTFVRYRMSRRSG